MISGVAGTANIAAIVANVGAGRDPQYPPPACLLLKAERRAPSPTGDDNP